MKKQLKKKPQVQGFLRAMLAGVRHCDPVMSTIVTVEGNAQIIPLLNNLNQLLLLTKILVTISQLPSS